MPRQKGVPNRRTKELEELIESRLPGFDPVLWMAEMAANGIDPIILETITIIVVMLEGVRGRTAAETTKIRKALVMLERMVGGQVVDKELRVACAKEVAQYLRPKRKAIEVTTDDGGPLKVNVIQNLT